MFSKLSKLGKLINIKVFLISFAIGMFIIYITEPDKKIIYVYPNPSNVDKIDFKDKADNCFNFDYKSVKCPKDMKKIEQYSVQSN